VGDGVKKKYPTRPCRVLHAHKKQSETRYIFRCVCKIVKKEILASLCPFICLAAWNNSAPIGQILMKFGI
jgi:hypothetical protein